MTIHFNFEGETLKEVLDSIEAATNCKLVPLAMLQQAPAPSKHEPTEVLTSDSTVEMPASADGPRKRGRQAKRAAAQQDTAQESTAAAVAPSAAPVGEAAATGAPPSPVAPSATFEDMRKALQDALNRVGLPKLKALMTEFGYQKYIEVKPEHFDVLVERAKALTA